MIRGVVGGKAVSCQAVLHMASQVARVPNPEASKALFEQHVLPEIEVLLRVARSLVTMPMRRISCRWQRFPGPCGATRTRTVWC